MATRAHWWRWPLLVLVFGFVLGEVALFVVALASGRIDPMPVDLLLGFNPLFWAVPGLVVLLKARWHTVGWMLILIGIGYGFNFSVWSTAVWEMTPLSPDWAAWIADGWAIGFAFAFTIGLLAVFPDGVRAQSRQDRKWSRGLIILAVAGELASVLVTEYGGQEGNLFTQSYPNPTGLGFIPPLWSAISFLSSFTGLVLGVWRLRRRARGAPAARHGQYTWVLFPFGLLVGILVLAVALAEFVGDVVWLPVIAMYFLVPLAFSIAIVRHRLFDIDRLVSRTVTYAVVALVVAAIYVVPVLVLPDLLGLSGDVAVAGATLLAAAAFAPLRRRVQGRVNRRFNRARYDAERIVSGLSGRLQALADRGAVVDELGGAAVAALQPRSVAVWLRVPGP